MEDVSQGADDFQQDGVRRLASSLAAITALVESIPEDDSTWVAGEGQWCLREVMGHLIDGDREIFRLRLELIFSESLEDWRS